MARIELTMPKMGESVAEAILVKWCKNIGDTVEVDETVVEIATDKVDSEVPSPYSGKLIEKLYEIDAVVQVGAVFGILESNVVSAIPQSVSENKPIEQNLREAFPLNVELINPENKDEVAESFKNQYNSLLNSSLGSSVSHSQKVEDTEPEARFYSPLVRQIAKSESLTKLELDSIHGSGQEGRVTKIDILEYVDRRNLNQNPNSKANLEKEISKPPLSSSSPNNSIIKPEGETKQESISKEDGSSEKAELKVTTSPGIKKLEVDPESDEIIQMDRMRRLISEHMVHSKNVSAHVTSFVEVDVTSIVRWRERIKHDFKIREKENITYTPIFLEAVAKSLRAMPMINVSVNGTSIVLHKKINIGMATALPNGNLIVPVIKNADQLNLIGLTKKVNDLANRARTGKLNPEDTQGGTFTITNVGSFGNLMGTPIINQPQVAILATGAIVKKPAVLETPEGDVIAIRHKLFLSLSYDHRVVDGALGGSFLRKIGDELEAFDVDRII